MYNSMEIPGGYYTIIMGYISYHIHVHINWYTNYILMK